MIDDLIVPLSTAYHRNHQRIF